MVSKRPNSKFWGVCSENKYFLNSSIRFFVFSLVHILCSRSEIHRVKIVFVANQFHGENYLWIKCYLFCIVTPVLYYHLYWLRKSNCIFFHSSLFGLKLVFFVFIFNSDFIKTCIYVYFLSL